MIRITSPCGTRIANLTRDEAGMITYYHERGSDYEVFVFSLQSLYSAVYRRQNITARSPWVPTIAEALTALANSTRAGYQVMGLEA